MILCHSYLIIPPPCPPHPRHPLLPLHLCPLITLFPIMLISTLKGFYFMTIHLHFKELI